MHFIDNSQVVNFAVFIQFVNSFSLCVRKLTTGNIIFLFLLLAFITLKEFSLLSEFDSTLPCCKLSHSYFLKIFLLFIQYLPSLSRPLARSFSHRFPFQYRFNRLFLISAHLKMYKNISNKNFLSKKHNDFISSGILFSLHRYSKNIRKSIYLEST